VALQTVVSRAVDPEETAVLSIGRLEAGNRGNIIPEEAKMSGTIRTFDPFVLERVLGRMQTILAGIGAAWEATVQFDHSTLPACVNDPESASIVERAAKSLLGPDRVAPARNNGADDMAYFLEAAPGAFFFLGGGKTSGNPPHHHPKFDFDEECLGIGAELGLRIIEEATGSRPGT
jgi:amidohydrolase